MHGFRLRLLVIVVLLLVGASFSVRWTARQSAAAETRPRVAVWVAPSGNDSTCARGNASKPCATLPGAYAVAKSGDTVLVASGSYSLAGSQTIPYDPSKVNSTLTSPCPDSARVTFRGSDSTHPSFTTPDRSGDALTIKATCLTFDGLDFNAEINVYTSSVTFENGRYEHNRGFPSGEDGFYIQKGNYITFRNIEVGPICCDNDGIDLFASPNGVNYGVTMDHVFVHDIVTACSQLSALANWSNCSSQSTHYNGNHVDCVQTLGMGNWTVENSRILNCTGGSGAPLQQGVYWDNNTYFDLLWQNNVIDTDNFGIGCGGTCNTTYGNNYVFKATVPPGYPDSGTKSYFKVLYNTLESSTGGEDMQPGGDYELIGNIESDAGNLDGCQLPATQGEGAGAVWSNASYNLFTSPSYGSAVAAACNKYGSNNITGRVRFADARRLDFHLARGSAGIARGGIGLGPREDLDGRLRPLRYPADVGAYVSESALISFGGRLGELRLGMSRAAVTALYGNPGAIGATPRRPGVRAVATYVRHGGNVWVTYGPSLTVVGLATDSRYFTTASGLGPGAPLSVLERAPLHFHAVCDRHGYRRTGGGTAVDLTVLGGKIKRVAINPARLAPSCK